MFNSRQDIDRAGGILFAGLKCAWALVGVGGVLAGLPAAAQESSGGSAAGERITSIQQYWDLSAEQKARPQSFTLRCHVTYFDPAWKMLFVQDAGGKGAYVPYGDNPFPFQVGRLIEAAGDLVPPNADVTFEHATIRDLGPGWPVPRPVAGNLTEVAALSATFVSVEAFVDHYRQLAPRHVQLALSVEGMPVGAWMQQELSDPLPDLRDATVRLEGVYNGKRGPDGKMLTLEIMVPTLAHVKILHRLRDDQRFQLPIVPIGSLAQSPADRLVRVTGRVKAQESGRFLRIRDDTGQIDIMTGQTRPCSINEPVEAVGFPSVNGTVWQLKGGLFRTSISPVETVAAKAPADPGPLQLAAQVLELSAEEAKSGRPVFLTGVVTWSHPDAPFFFIQDASGGVCVLRGDAPSVLRSIGRYLEVRGVTAMGQFAPVIQAARYDKISDMVLPLAQQTSLEHALTGAEEAQWVEMRGYLRQIRKVDGWNQLELATPTGDFVAMLPAQADASGMIGAVVRLHGVCTASANEQRKLTGIKLWVPNADYVQVEEPAPENPFDLPVRSLASLGQYNGLQTFSRRIRVAGTVLQHSPGHLIYIQDEGDSLQILSRGIAPLSAADRIEAVGFIGRQGGRVVLREAVYRKIGQGLPPVARPLKAEKTPLAAEDGALVRMEGTLIGHSQAGGQTRLTLQTPETVFEAYLEGSREGAAGALAALPHNSRVALTGVYEVKYDEFGQPAACQLSLRSPADVTVLESPSWWTRGRILGFTGTLALGTLIIIAWVAALRRRVGEQTEQIREQLKRESWLEAELQRAGKLESLGLLAGGIAHDFNNLLTVMMGNMSLAGLDENITAETSASLRTAEKAAVRARDLTQQLLTFAKGGAPIRAAVSLPEVVREVAEFALRGAKTRCEFAFAPDLWPANVDKGQIGQVVQNIVINAVQAMATGGFIRITLGNETVGPDFGQMLVPGRYVQLGIADHGPGIAPEDLGRIFDPYFTTKKQGNGLGLATVYSIIKKHLGHISAESVLGVGTTFKIWLPAAEHAPEPDLPAVAAAGSAPGFKRRARVLFMDDEESICQLGRSFLRRLGKDVTAVHDGEAAVTEYRRAQETGEPYDLVILDLTIPGGMGGRETIERLRALNPHVKAIVSSGYSNDLVLSDYQSHGFRGMVTKPYEIADFSTAVERVLKGERA